MKYADVLLLQKVGDRSVLTYEVPAKLSLTNGDSVQIPLRNKETSGIVFRLHNNKPEFKTLEIISKNYQKTLLKKESLELLKWLSSYYLTPLNSTLKLFVNSRILANKPYRKTKKANKEQIISTKKKSLTKDQLNAFNKITTSSVNKFLIHGVTGSGKTEIYCHLAEKYIDEGKQVLILVPEISLTPQTINYFQKTIGIKAAVIHSKRAAGERYQAWQDIRSQKAKLIIGSRSAIFSPLQNPGLIIIDEEHENSYKQDSCPRYCTHQVANHMLKLYPALKLVLGSATPSIATSELLKANCIQINERIGASTLPDIEIVDLREEFKKKNYSIFSDRLHEEITETLKNNKQIILFLNRRGLASSIVCRDCGYTIECPSCNLPMTFHKSTLSNPSLICHHCGKILNPPSSCPECKGPNIRFIGIGTQKIEEETIKAFPNAKVLRADKDTTSKKDSFAQIYKKFKNHEADILIGTQMIAKGLHLPNVHLVGIIIADIGLNIPDYKTAEQSYQLITQVSGRAGRSKVKGKVIIQTYAPENLSLNYAKNNNYSSFFNYERKQRKLLSYPPFAKITKIIVEDKNNNEAIRKTEQLERDLHQIAREENLTEQLEINSYPAYIMRLRNKYRHIVLIKDKSNRDLIHKTLEKLPKEYIMDPSIKFDIDPISIT